MKCVNLIVKTCAARLSVGLFLLLFSLASTAQRAQITADGKGAVASVHQLATQAGIEAFNQGGNAIDAALAVAYTLGVVDSHNSGVGGGCFILVRLASGEILAIDGREMAPAKAHRDMYLKAGEYQSDWSKTGALAAGIPGSVMALEKLHSLGGKKKLADLILPAAGLAEKGFAIDRILATRLNSLSSKLSLFPASKQIFVKNEGREWLPGETLIQKDLAGTYRQLAKNGSAYFYQGAFAKKTAQWMKKNGGIITREDFKRYQLVLREPIVTEFYGHQLYGFPPPSSGGIAVAHILALIEQSGYEFKKLDETDRYHLVIEAMRLAFADRANWLGDSDFVPVPKNLISPVYAKRRIKDLSLKKAAVNVQHGVPHNADTDIFNRHTTHITAADTQGNWVAITTTLNTGFGSKVTIPGTGVLLNNQMDDFSAQPGSANAFGLVGAEANGVAPGKRPLSSMSPTLVMKNNQPVLTIGAAGGPTIISQVAQGILYHLVLGLPLDAAIARARVHHQWHPDKVYVDNYMDKKIRNELSARGFLLVDWPGFGSTQGIAMKDSKFLPVSEPRLQQR